MLYYKEIRMAEAEVRSSLKAIGGEMARRISDQILFDWCLLDGGIGNGNGNGVRVEGEQLKVFKVVSEDETRFIAHPIKELLTVVDAPFPIDAGFNTPLKQDQWVETFPILESKITLSLGTSNERVYELQKSHLFFRIGTFIVLVGLIGGGLVALFLRKLGKPLRALCLTMKRVAEGAVHSRYVPQMWGFEINAVGRTFNETLDEMLIHSQEAENQRLKREKLAQELRLGHEIQASMLPKEFPKEVHFEITAGCLPANEVGGDFYDVFPLGGGKTLIAVADVAGKGISACLFSLGLRSSLRALAANLDSLAEVVKKGNELFLADAEETSQFATLWIAILEDKRLHFISLGHPPALLKREGAIHELSTQYSALGAMPYGSIEAKAIDLQPGDEILLYSDGATEAMDVDGKLYGVSRLKTAFLQCGQTDGAKEILEEIQRFSHGAVQHDDLTVLYLRS
jgi:sigma-B regulation protein RsbU (phosphoserine phosphatase)